MVLVGRATAVLQERRRNTGFRMGLFSAGGNVWKTCTQRRKDSWSRNGWCCLIGNDDDDRFLLHHDDTAHGGGRGRSRTSNGKPVAMELAEEEAPP